MNVHGLNGASLCKWHLTKNKSKYHQDKFTRFKFELAMLVKGKYKTIKLSYKVLLKQITIKKKFL